MGASIARSASVARINQLRQKIGVVYGNPKTTTGGNALKFCASVRLDIRKIGVVKNGEQAIGNKTRVKSGAYYSWNGERIAQGRDKACQYMSEHPELAAELRDKLVALRMAENARLGAPAAMPGGESAAA